MHFGMQRSSVQDGQRVPVEARLRRAAIGVLVATTLIGLSAIATPRQAQAASLQQAVTAMTIANSTRNEHEHAL